MPQFIKSILLAVQAVWNFFFNSTSLLIVSSFMVGIVAGKNISTQIDGMLFLGGVFGLGIYQWIGVRDFQVSQKQEKQEVHKAVRKLEKKFDRHVGSKKHAIVPE